MKRNNKVSVPLWLTTIGFGLFLVTTVGRAALVDGTTLTINQGSGSCTQLTCSNLSGSYALGGYSNGPNNFTIGSLALLQDGYDDATGAFNGGATGGKGIIIGSAQPYNGNPVGTGMPYDPSVGQNITSAFLLNGTTYGTFYSTSPITDNGNGTLNFTGWNTAWGEYFDTLNPAIDYYVNVLHQTPQASITTTGTGGAFGAGTYSLDYFIENCQTSNFECDGFKMHLEGSIKPVPIETPASVLLLSGLAAIIRRRRQLSTKQA